jgi:hypothetical protein
MENVQVNVQMNIEMKAHDETTAITEAARCIIGHLKRMKRKHFITGKLDTSITLGPVAEGADGGLCDIINIHTILIP